MKRILIVTSIVAVAGVSFCALNNSAIHDQLRLQNNRTEWIDQTQKLAQVQSEVEALSNRLRDLQTSAQPALATVSDPALVDLLLTNDLSSLSLQQQNKLLAELGGTGASAGNYVLVAKSVLANSHLKAFKDFPDLSQLTPAARQVLAIQPEEQKSVEAAFADAMQRTGNWAQANVKRQGASSNLLVSYTLPVDADFAKGVNDQLFTTVSNVLGAQRTQLLQNYFGFYRIYEDGANAVNTNKLEVYRMPGKPGLFYRGGWDMGSSSAMNTYPEPIRDDRFPAAFRFIFPGGWQELAQREGFELVEPPAEK
jgi:hypothetical protein